MSGVCTFVSFRLGGTDGVSVVAAAWAACLAEAGWTIRTVAGAGPVDHLVPGLAIGATEPPTDTELDEALADADVVVAENILSIPMQLPASRVLARVLAGRPAVLHHHDPPWQRARFAHVTELPPDDPAWHHVTINQLTEAEFRARGLAATTIYNGFDTTVAPGDRAATRELLGLAPHTTLVAHPVRAIARKGIPTAIDLAAALDAVYWLPGPAEEGYGTELDRLIDASPVRVIRTAPAELGAGQTMPDLYAAADLVAFPSTWEGFGNPPFEAAIHSRPVAVGRYPVATELRRLGFWWLDPTDHAAVAAAVTAPNADALARNRAIVEEHLSLDRMATRVNALFEQAGLHP
ncbi:MAG: glycosyltransferase [Actinomycetota bacterium]